MKILKTILALIVVFAIAAIAVYSYEQPAELGGFFAEPGSIQPGVETTFTFVFNTPMDTSADPNVLFKMPDDNDLLFPVYWDGQYKCKLSYAFPNANESGTVQITLTGARTREGKDIGDIQASVKVIPPANSGK